MNLQKITGLIIALWLTTSAAHAQKQSLTGITRLNSSSVQPIYEKSEVKGYMFFYKSDLADKKNSNYGMDVFDEDLGKVKSIVMQKPRAGYYLLRNAYNGSAFGLYFFDHRNESMELETYDKGLNKIASIKIPNLSKGDMLNMQQELRNGNLGENVFSGIDVFPVPGNGFVRKGSTGLYKGYELEMYDDALKSKWKTASSKNSKDMETLVVSEVTDKYITAFILRRSSILSTHFDFSIAAFDVETGEKVMDLPAEANNKERLSISSLSYDPQKQEFMALGEFYNLKDKPFVNKSQGFFMKRFDLTGKEKSARFHSWSKDVKSILPEAAQKSVENNYINFIHRVVKGSNGNTYLLTEQYKVVTSGAGIAVKAMGGQASAMKGKIANMLVFAIDPTDNLSEIKFYPKEARDYALRPGIGIYGAGLIGYFIKSEGGFDYQFTQSSQDSRNFSLAYLDINKQSKKITTSLVNVMFDDSNTFLTDNVDITTGKNSKALTYPGKTGHNMVVEYNPATKTIEMRLVKLNK